MTLAQLVLSRTDIVKNSLSELSAKTTEAASDLWDTLWSSDIKDLKVKKGKECPSALQRAGGSH